MGKKIPLKLIVGTVSNEKGVSEEVIFEAVEAALISATKKKYGSDIDVRVIIDRESGTYDTFRVWKVVPDPEEGECLEFPEIQMTLSDAKKKQSDIKIDAIWQEQMESVDFGRIAAQTAKQVIIQKVKEAERALVAAEYSKKVGELITGVVKKTTRDSVILDLGSNAEGLLKKDKILPRESFRPGDRVRAYLEEVAEEVRGPQLMVSRTCDFMLIKLFEIEVPEVGEGIIEIKATARDAGMRSKIAVKTNDGRMDPVGACVGMRGARVQAVSNELGGERVDVILWDDNPAQFVMNAMAPAEIVSIVVDEETRSMDIAVKDEFLSQAIGRGGQNVKLASLLTGWELNVIGDAEAKQKDEQETGRLKDVFIGQLQVEEEVADVLIQAGFTSLEEIAYVPVQELLEIEGFDEEIVGLLRARAKDILLTQAIVTEEEIDKKAPAEDLLEVEGITKQMAYHLAQNDVLTRDDLAELSVDDLREITELDKEQAAKLIMAARAHWFADEQ